MDKTVNKNENERVEVFIPRGKEDAIIGINGIMYQLPQGKTSLVPPEVAAEYRRSQQALEIAEANRDRLKSASK